MHSELVEGLVKLGFREYLASCPSCGLSGMVMRNHDDPDGDKACPRCGETISLIEAPRAQTRKARWDVRLAVLSALLIVIANVTVVTHQLHSAPASVAVFAFQMAWVVMVAAWLTKR